MAAAALLAVALSGPGLAAQEPPPGGGSGGGEAPAAASDEAEPKAPAAPAAGQDGAAKPAGKPPAKPKTRPAAGQGQKPAGRPQGGKPPVARAKARPEDDADEQQIELPEDPIEAFAVLVQMAFELEGQAMSYEQRTLGSEDIDTLMGYRLKRRQRIDTDREDFAERLAAVPLRALRIVTAAEARVELSTKELFALDSLNRVYRETRSPTGVRLYMASNRKFLLENDWQDRDRAVKIRDELMIEEAEFLRLADLARRLSRGEADEDAAEQILESLRIISPDTMDEATDVTGLILRDEVLRDQVVREAEAFLRTPSARRVPEQGADALAAVVPQLQLDLVSASGLSDVRDELVRISFELEDIEARLKDRGVNSLTTTERAGKVRRKAELTARQAQLQHEWLNTPPAQAQLASLLEVLDQVTVRRMHELGFQGALYARRHDELSSARPLMLETSYTTWEYLDEVTKLLTDLDEARGEPDPLEGLVPPPDPKYIAQQTQLILALKKTRPDLFIRIPKPRPPAGKKGKKAPPRPRPKGGGGKRPR